MTNPISFQLLKNKNAIGFPVLFLIAFLFSGSAQNQLHAQVIFTEPFNEATGATTGVDNTGGVAWTAVCPTCLSGDHYHVQGGQLEGQDTNGPATWETGLIDISSCPFIEISFTVSESGTMEGCGTGCNSVDWVQFEYNIDGTGWQTPSNSTFCSGGCAGINVIQADDILTGSMLYTTGCMMSGNSIQLRITVQAWATDEFWRIDDVTVSCSAGPSVDAGTDQTICNGGSVTLTAANPDAATLSWNNGITNGVSFVPPVGSTTYIVTATQGACFSTDEVEVTVADISVDAGADQTVCEGAPVTLTASNPDGASLSWSGGVTDGVAFTQPVGSVNYTVTATDLPSGCFSTDAVNVTVIDLPTVTVNPAGPFSTVGGTQTITASPAGGTWSTDCGACIHPTTGVFNPATAGGGTWEICYTAGTAPCTQTTCIFITVATSCILNGSITSNNPTCFGFSDGSVSIHVSGTTGTPQFAITNSAGTVVNSGNSNAANNLPGGWYYFNVTDDVACTFIDSVLIEDPGPLAVDIVIQNPLCYGVDNGFVFIDTVYNYTGAYSQVGYFWNPNPTGLNGLGEDSLLNVGEGSYNLLINDQNGCSESYDFEIQYPDSLYLVEFGSEPAYCRVFGYQTGNGVVFAAAAGGTPDYAYEWTNLNSGVTSSSTTWGGLNPGSYQIAVTDDNGCILTKTRIVDSLNPVADFTLTSADLSAFYEGNATVDVHLENQSLYYANPNDPNADTTFFWHFGFDAAPWILSEDVTESFDVSYAEGGEYNICLVALNKNGCSDTSCILITVYDSLTFAPVNIFTPNGDGVNDFFTFNDKSSSIENFYCVIVNRWGVVITEMVSVSDSWTGTDKGGNECPSGVYFYSYEWTSFNGIGSSGQGTVQLVRSE